MNCIKKKFFICSVAQPGEDYEEENYDRCLKYNGHFMHKNTTMKGVFNSVSVNDIIFLKYQDKLIAYGQVSKREISKEKQYGDWNYIIFVNEWIFFDKENNVEGVSKYGVGDNTLPGAGQMATIKEVTEKFASQKMKEIDSTSEVYCRYVQEKNMRKYITLLKNSKNLILTGAPGTGKTFLANKIAEAIVREGLEIKYTPTEFLEKRLKEYKIDSSQRKKDTELFAELRATFPIENITNISIEDYCIGTGEQGGFCWFLERKLWDQGHYSPAQRGSYVYGIYYDKKSETYNTKNELVGTNEEVLSTVLNAIKTCLDNKNKISVLNEQKEIIDGGFILKILNSYYPDEFLQINTKSHLQNIVKLFSVDCKAKDNIFELERSLFNFYKNLSTKLNADIKPCEFVRIIYNNFNVATGEWNTLSGSNITTDDLRPYIGFVQFHQSYDYTDFVEGLRPVNDDNDSNTISFKRKNGVFKEFCKQAALDSIRNYVFIIDEINRGEMSKIFGELFFSIDPGYRSKENRKPISTQYQNLMEDTENEPFKKGFYVPENVYILGTMNDIDRGVETIDFAFRRRFAWEEVTAKETQRDILKEIDTLQVENITTDKLCQLMNAINEKIESIEGLSSAYDLGAAYFLKIKDYINVEGDQTPYEKLWDYNLKPILREYLRGMDEAQTQLDNLYKIYKDEVNKN